MFDIGSWEFLVIIVIALIVIGPRDLPGVVRSVRQWIRRARELAQEFQSGLEEMAREAELDKVKDELASGLDVEQMAREVKEDLDARLDPDGAVGEAFELDDQWSGAGPEPAPAEDAAEPTIADPKRTVPAEGEETAAEAPQSAKPGA